MDLRGQDPTKTFQYLVTTDGTHLFNGTGSLMTSLTITSITSSFVTESFASASFLTASSIQVIDGTFTRLTASAVSIPTASFTNLSASSANITTLGATTLHCVGIGAGLGGIQDPVIVWNPDGQSYFQASKDSLVIGQLDLSYTWNNGGNSENVIVISTSSVSILPPIIGTLQGTANTASYISSSAIFDKTAYNLTASFSQTSSALNFATASISASNSSSIVAWISITVSGSVYKLPLYQ